MESNVSAFPCLLEIGNYSRLEMLFVSWSTVRNLSAAQLQVVLQGRPCIPVLGFTISPQRALLCSSLLSGFVTQPVTVGGEAVPKSN